MVSSDFGGRAWLLSFSRLKFCISYAISRKSRLVRSFYGLGQVGQVRFVKIGQLGRKNDFSKLKPGLHFPQTFLVATRVHYYLKFKPNYFGYEVFQPIFIWNKSCLKLIFTSENIFKNFFESLDFSLHSCKKFELE